MSLLVMPGDGHFDDFALPLGQWVTRRTPQGGGAQAPAFVGQPLRDRGGIQPPPALLTLRERHRRLRGRIRGRRPIAERPIVVRCREQPLAVLGRQRFGMAGNGIGQRQRQLVGEFARPLRHRSVAPLRRHLQADQLMRRLTAVARLGSGLANRRHRVGQVSARRQRPSGRDSEGGVHVHVVGGHALPGFGERFVRLGRLPEFGVRLGQREAGGGPQTRCDAVVFDSRECFVQKFDRSRAIRHEPVGLTQQEYQVGIGEARERRSPSRPSAWPCSTHSSMRPVNRHARAYTPPNQNRKCAVWKDVDARSSARSATAVSSSARPSAPSAIINANDAIIA